MFALLLLKFFVISILIDCYLSEKDLKRAKRDAYDLPDGWDLLMGPIKPTFVCVNDGYYADVDNGCQLYHVCQSVPRYDGNTNMMQYTFICGNGTVFNQLTLTCSYADESIPCESSPDFFYINERIGEPQTNFLYDEDLERGSKFGRTPSRRFQKSAIDAEPDNDFA